MTSLVRLTGCRVTPQFDFVPFRVPQFALLAIALRPPRRPDFVLDLHALGLQFSVELVHVRRPKHVAMPQVEQLRWPTSMPWLALPRQGGPVPRRPGWAGRAITDQLLERLPQAIARHIPQPVLGLRDIVSPGLRLGRQAIVAHQSLIRGIIPFKRGPRALGVPRG